MTDTGILHDELISDGGAERVAIELARTFDAPLFALRVDQTAVPGDVDARELLPDDPLERIEGSRLVPNAVQWLAKHLHRMERTSYLEPIHEFDTVIQSKPGAGWYIQNDEQTVIRYTHHGFRRHYSLFDRGGKALKHRLWSLCFRTLSRQTVDYPELLVCNSDLTAQRLRDQHAVSEERLRVCYPPVAVDALGPHHASPEWDGCYLHLGRLAHNKCLPEIVETFQGRSEALVLAGDGPERDRVEALAAGHDNIHVLGRVSEQEKRTLLASARAFIMHARNEDFGIAPVEALASGTPVLGVDEPFTNHQVLDGKNGLLFDRGRLGDAIDRFERTGVAWDSQRIADAAAVFSTERFRSRMRELVALAEQRSAIEPRWRQQTDITTPAPTSTDAIVADGGVGDE